MLGVEAKAARLPGAGMSLTLSVNSSNSDVQRLVDMKEYTYFSISKYTSLILKGKNNAYKVQ